MASSSNGLTFRWFLKEENWEIRLESYGRRAGIPAGEGTGFILLTMGEPVEIFKDSEKTRAIIWKIHLLTGNGLEEKAQKV